MQTYITTSPRSLEVLDLTALSKAFVPVIKVSIIQIHLFVHQYVYRSFASKLVLFITILLVLQEIFKLSIVFEDPLAALPI